MSEIPVKGWKLQQHSFSKMIVWFEDGNIRTRYSIDWKHKYSQRDRAIGLNRFKQKIAEYGTRACSIEIYDLRTNQIIGKFYKGTCVIELL